MQACVTTAQVDFPCHSEIGTVRAKTAETDVDWVVDVFIAFRPLQTSKVLVRSLSLLEARQAIRAVSLKQQSVQGHLQNGQA